MTYFIYKTTPRNSPVDPEPAAQQLPTRRRGPRLGPPQHDHFNSNFTFNPGTAGNRNSDTESGVSPRTIPGRQLGSGVSARASNESLSPAGASGSAPVLPVNTPESVQLCPAGEYSSSVASRSVRVPSRSDVSLEAATELLREAAEVQQVKEDVEEGEDTQEDEEGGFKTGDGGRESGDFFRRANTLLPSK